MEAWDDMYIPKEVLWALREQGFTEPTPIQRQVLPSAIRDQMDIVGAAETVCASRLYLLYIESKITWDKSMS